MRTSPQIAIVVALAATFITTMVPVIWPRVHIPTAVPVIILGALVATALAVRTHRAQRVIGEQTGVDQVFSLVLDDGTRAVLSRITHTAKLDADTALLTVTDHGLDFWNASRSVEAHVDRSSLHVAGYELVRTLVDVALANGDHLYLETRSGLGDTLSARATSAADLYAALTHHAAPTQLPTQTD